MTKARFSDQQPKVKVTSAGSQNYFQICLNEKKVEVHEPDQQYISHYEWEYDFHDFHDDVTDPDEVKKYPEKYLDYKPIDSMAKIEAAASTEKRLQDLESKQEETAQAMQDVLTQLLGGE